MKIDFYELCDSIEEALKKLGDMIKDDNVTGVEAYAQAATVQMLIGLLDYAE